MASDIIDQPVQSRLDKRLKQFASPKLAGDRGDAGAELLQKTKINERRLTERVRKKWAQKNVGRLPSLTDMEALNLGPDKPFCFAIDLRLSDILPYFVFMGDELMRYSTLYPMGDPRREKSLLDAAMNKMDEAALNREPVEFSDVKKLDDGRRVAFRTVLLPISENGEDVTHIFGAASGKLL